MNISESKDFPVHTKSLKEVRDFAREIFDKSPIFNNQKDELVLAIAEAAQNIVKHAYKDVSETKDIMQIKISFKDNELTIGFYDKGKPVNTENIKQGQFTKMFCRDGTMLMINDNNVLCIEIFKEE